jgi:hypothetical protein
MSKEEKIKQLLCGILREICDATDSTDLVEFDATAYIPKLRYMPTFCFTEEDIEIIKDLSDEMLEDFSILTDD